MQDLSQHCTPKKQTILCMGCWCITIKKIVCCAEDEEKSPEKKPAMKYTQFWNEFGKAMKLGIMEDTNNRNRLSKLLRFYTSKSPDKLASLEEYVSRMKEGQKQIYYLCGQSMEEIKASPFLERYYTCTQSWILYVINNSVADIVDLLPMALKHNTQIPEEWYYIHVGQAWGLFTHYIMSERSPRAPFNQVPSQSNHKIHCLCEFTDVWNSRALL